MVLVASSRPGDCLTFPLKKKNAAMEAIQKKVAGEALTTEERAAFFRDALWRQLQLNALVLARLEPVRWDTREHGRKEGLCAGLHIALSLFDDTFTDQTAASPVNPIIPTEP